MRMSKAKLAVLATLSVVAIALGIAVFTVPAEKEQYIPISIAPTPEVANISLKAEATPVLPAPTLPSDMVKAELAETPVNTASSRPTKAPNSARNTPKVSGAFALGIGKSMVQIANGVDERTLEKTPGWLTTSAQPGQEGVCVVYGHRNRNHLKVLENVKEGDAIMVYTKDGTAYTYIVETIEILDNEADLRIPTLSGSHLMLTTCYPFRYSGHAPQKFVVRACISR